MDVWERLTTTAVLGTERQPVDLSADGPLGTMLAKLQGQDAEHQLLGAAAMVSLYRRAGTAPTVDAEPLPAPATTDNRPECPPRARECLAIILGVSQGDMQSQVLPEWLALLQAAGARAPEDFLPELLERGRQHSVLREAIAAVAGERGVWLAQQHPGWAYVTGETDTASFATRRRQNPAQAREELAAEWPALDAKARESLLPALAAGLCPDDEPFLESALNDKRKEVRLAAADLLARLPGSRFALRMRERADALLTFIPAKPVSIFPPSPGKPARLEVTPPAECDKAMQRDGMQAKIPTQVQYTLRGLSEPNWWVLQVLSFVPPDYWSARWRQTPKELLALTQGQEWRDAVRNGWVRATLRFRDPAWAEELYPLTVPSHDLMGNWAELMTFLPQDHWEDITQKALFGRQADTEMLPPVVGLLQGNPHPWSPQLTKAVEQRLRELLQPATFQQSNWSGMWGLVSGCLLAFAEHAPVALLPEMIDRLQQVPPMMTDSPFRGNWENLLASAVGLMQLRSTMHQAFKKETV